MDTIFDLKFEEEVIIPLTFKGLTFVRDSFADVEGPSSNRANYERAWAAGLRISFSTQEVQKRLTQEVVDVNNVSSS